MKHDLRWLFFVAWPLFVFGIWKLTRQIPYNALRIWTVLLSSILLAVALLITGIWLAPVQLSPYPWLAWAYLGDTKSPLSIRLMLLVSQYPSADNTPPPALSIVNACFTRPVYVNPNADGWWSCIIAALPAVEWHDIDGALRPLGDITTTGTTPILVESNVYDRNGLWRGKLVVQQGGGIKQIFSGKVHKGDDLFPLSMFNSDFGFNGIKHEWRISPDVGFSREELISYGVPVHESSASELATVCGPGGYSYEQSFNNVKKVTVKPNFGK